MIFLGWLTVRIQGCDHDAVSNTVGTSGVTMEVTIVQPVVSLQMASFRVAKPLEGVAWRSSGNLNAHTY